jgi:hypothetical protein
MLGKKRMLLGMLMAAALWMSGVASATNFAILLGGGSNGDDKVELEGVDSVEIDPVTIDVLELPAPENSEYRLYGPGKSHWGNAKFTSACTLGGSKELQAWFQEAAKGKNIRKNITVTLFRTNSIASKSYVLYDCFPVAWEPGACTGGTRSEFDTFTVSIGGGRIEQGAGPDPLPNTRPNLRIGVQNADGSVATERVTGIWSGGEPQLIQQWPFRTAKFHTFSPGHKSIAEITLRSSGFSGKKGYDWLNASFDNQHTRKTLTITEMLSVDGGVKDGKQYIYHDCFPIRYVFPRMSVTNTTGNTMEEVTVKPIRLELK